MHFFSPLTHSEPNAPGKSCHKASRIQVDKNNSTEKLHLLIVENDRQNLAFLYKELKNHYTIFRSIDNAEASKILTMYKVDFVLANAKSTSSEEDNICKIIKSSTLYNYIPVLLLIDPNNSDSKLNSLKSGADAYLDHPISIPQLTAQIQNILFNREIIKKHLSPALNKNDSDLNNSFIQKIYDIIEKGISDSNFTVDQLAKLMNMSRATLYRKLRQFSNLKPNEIIIKLKLDFAAKLLAKGIYSVSQVATMVGYSLQSNFSRDFKKYSGVQPSIYLSKD